MKKIAFLAALILALLALAGCSLVTVTVGSGPLEMVGSAPLAAAGPTGHVEDPLPPSYDIYETFGLAYDAKADTLTFGGERVRYFFDGVDTGDGGKISRLEHIDPAGTVDVHTVRETADNGDGSVDPFGPLTGLEADSAEVFAARDIDALLHPRMEATTLESSGEPGKTFAEIFAAYRDFGVEFVESPEASGTGNVYHLGELVKTFADVSPEGGSFVYHSRDGGTCNVRTVYDEAGELTGVERVMGDIKP